MSRMKSPITILAGEALEPFRRVMFNGTAWVYADAKDQHHAVTCQYIANAAYGAAWTADDSGVMPVESNGTITAPGLAYGADDGKVSATVTETQMGVVLETVAQYDIAKIIQAPNPSGLLYSNTAASTAISNTTTPTDFSLSYTIPANSMKAGDVYRIKGQGIATATNSTDTLAVDLEFGGVDLYTIAAVDVADNDIFEFQADVLIRTIGASGTLVAHGFAGAFGAAGTATARSRFKASTAIDTTAAALVVAEATWSVASASNSCRLDAFTVERLRA